MTPFDLSPSALDAGGAAAAQRLAAIDHTLFGLRAFRAEVEQVRPALVLDRIDGWHSVAADLYSGRATEVRYALAGAEQLLLDAEAELVAARDRVRAAWPTAPTPGGDPTPVDPVPGSVAGAGARP